MTTTIRIFVFVLALALLGFSPALAEKGDSKIRFGAQFLGPTGDFKTTDGTEAIEIEADSAFGPFFEYEYMVTGKVGVFGNVSTQNHDVDAEVTDTSPGGSTQEATIADVDVMPIEFGVNFYVVQKDSVEFFLGPKVAYVFFGDVELEPQFVDPGDPDKVSTNEDLGFGVNFGVDVPFGNSGWGFFGGLQYMQFTLETDEGTDSAEIDVDPYAVRVGVSKKF